MSGGQSHGLTVGQFQDRRCIEGDGHSDPISAVGLFPSGFNGTPDGVVLHGYVCETIAEFGTDSEGLESGGGQS